MSAQTDDNYKFNGMTTKEALVQMSTKIDYLTTDLDEVKSDVKDIKKNVEDLERFKVKMNTVWAVVIGIGIIMAAISTGITIWMALQ